MKNANNDKPLFYLSHYINSFLKLEAMGGILIIAASIVALLLANSPYQQHYFQFLQSHLTVGLEPWVFKKPFLLWINDGLMALFFLLIGLELKREVVEGQLSQLSQILLPAVAALGGIIVPALIYIAFNWHDPISIRGWAIPTATDIAFALSILSLLGSRVPQGLKIFLMTVTIFDDISAIIIIALFYAGDLSGKALLGALILLVLLILLNRAKVQSTLPYLFLGLLLWICVLNSGVHATLAGFILALTIPMQKAPYRLESRLHGWVTYGILPLFAFANAGISFLGITQADVFSPLTLGIALGLLLGKQAGIFSFTWCLVTCKMGALPDNVHWGHIYGVALLCGIGFTMSLFISTLAFEFHPASMMSSRLGIFCGTAISALLGYFVLRRVLR